MGGAPCVALSPDAPRRGSHANLAPSGPCTAHAVPLDGHEQPDRGQPRTYEVRTYGCQMNVHDSERLTGLLEDAGYVAAPAGRAGRRRRVQHLRGAGERRQQALRQPRPPRAGEGRAARACRSRSAAAWRRRTAARSPGGRRGSTSSSAPTTSARCRCCSSGPGSQRGGAGRDPRVARGVPVDAADPARVGVRRLGVDQRRAATTPARSASSRRCAARRRTAGPATILAEIEALVAEGVIEVTLLGQNVNSYGVEFGDRQAFGKLLRACGDDRRARAGPVHLAAPGGLHRRRDRRDGRDAERDAAAAHAAAVRLRPGAARRCAAPTGRRRTSASSTGSAPRCPTPRSPPTSSSASPARPRTTSRETLRRRASRRGSPARSPSSTPSGPARRPPTLRRPGAARRSCRSATSGWSRCVDEIAWAENQRARRPHRRGAGRRGRGPQGRRHPPAVRPRPRQPARALHAGRRTAAVDVRPGDMVEVEVTYAAPHHLVADGARAVRTSDPRRRRLGGPDAPRRPPGVLLGLPTVGVPAPLEPVAGCS